MANPDGSAASETWTNQLTWNTGGVGSAAMQTYVAQCLAYLKGVLSGSNLQAVLINGAKDFQVGDTLFYLRHTSPGAASSPTVNFDTDDVFYYDRTNNRYVWQISASERLRVDTNGVQSGPGTSKLMRVHRHPYATNRHVEAGTVTTSNSAEVTKNFNGGAGADSFGAAPTVIATVNKSGSTNGRVICISNVGNRGFDVSLYDNSGNRIAETLYWIAEGQSA